MPWAGSRLLDFQILFYADEKRLALISGQLDVDFIGRRHFGGLMWIKAQEVKRAGVINERAS